MNSAYYKNVSQLFTKGSHYRKISLVLITQIVFHLGPSSRDISLNSKYIVVFRNPTDKSQMENLARKATPKTFPVFTRRT